MWVGALDGGGTKTAAALADRAGAVRVLPVLPGCNPQDGPGWEPTLRAALSALSALEGAPGSLAAATLGLPGWGEVPALDAGVARVLAARLPVRREAMNDVALAHLGAFAGGEGVLVLSGTGSMAWARGPGGEARVGGWGDAFGDEGSAHWIGREALALAARAMDGRDAAEGAAAFARALCARLGPEALGPFAPLAWLMAQGSGRAAIAGVARHVDAMAADGDASARLILESAARELVGQARAAARRAGLGDVFAWAAAGGAFQSLRLRAAVAAAMGRAPADPRMTTLGGGLLHAARLAGWAPGPGWAARVDAQVRAA